MSSRNSHELFTNCPFETKSQYAVGNYRKTEETNTGEVNLNESATEQSIQLRTMSQDIFKAFIPWYLYKPPYGYPRDVNPLELRLFAKNPYVFSVIKAIQDEVTNTEYDIVLKEEYAKEEEELDDEARRSILHFFNNPNGNPRENFKTLLKSWIRDIAEIGNCIGVKVFDKNGNFKQLVARDASTFLLNTDIYGMLDTRADFVEPPTYDLLTQDIPNTIMENYKQAKDMQSLAQTNDQIKNKSYDELYSDSAAYFQYGWTAGARPVPFGKREILWVEMNPRTDNIYPMSPIQILWNTILTLVYGLEYNLDFYLNNNLPNGILYLENANQLQAESYRQQMAKIFMESDEYGNQKKKHFNVPISSYKPEFVNMQMSSKEMQVIEQQKWFTKLLYASFGVNANEMGYIEDVNRANGDTQERAIIRKMVKPFLIAFEDAINKQLMYEFGHPEFEFKFVEYSIDEEKKKQDLYEQQLRMGIKSPEMVAKEMGIDVEEVKKFRQEQEEKEMQKMQQFNNQDNQDKSNFNKNKQNLEKKSLLDEYNEIRLLSFAKAYGVNLESLKEGIAYELENSSPFSSSFEIIMTVVNNLGEPDYYIKKKTQMKSLQKNLIENSDLEKYLKKEMGNLKKKVLTKVNQTINENDLIQFKGFIDIKGLMKVGINGLSNYLNSPRTENELKKFLKTYLFKGIEKIEKQLNINILGTKIRSNILDSKQVTTMHDFIKQLVSELNERIINRVQKEVGLGILNGESIKQIENRINKIFRNEIDNVETIARTESARIINKAESLAAKNSGLNLRKYLSVHLDNKTSPICQELHLKYGSKEQSIPQDKDFSWSVNKGGSTQTMPAHHNCRTSLMWIQEEDYKKLGV